MKWNLLALWYGQGARRLVRAWAIGISLAIVSSISCAATPEVGRGLAWLQAQAITLTSQLAQSGQAQCESAITLRALGGSAFTADTLMQALPQPGESVPTEILGCTLALRGVSAGLTTELSLRKRDSGYAAYRDHAVASVVDTVWVIRGFGTNLSQADRNAAYGYLQSTQATDGSFLVGGSSNLATTAWVLRSLTPLINQDVAVAQIAGKAAAWLLTQHKAGIWANDAFLTALVYEAVQPYSASQPDLGSQVASYLIAQQQTDGSWSSDVYLTALALRALAVAGAPILDPLRSNLTLSFVDGRTNAPLPGVLVTGVGTSLASSDAAGQVDLRNLNPGNYQVVATLASYGTVTVPVILGAGQTLKLDTIQMLPVSNPTTAVVQGVIKDLATGQGLSGATVQVEGQNLSSTTAANGSYLISSVTPGSVRITASKTGYNGASGQGTVSAGQALIFSPLLSVADTSNTGTPTVVCKVSGVVTDANTKQPIQGATISISGVNNASANTDATGRYSIANLVSGALAIQVSQVGYDLASVSTQVMCNPRQTVAVDFSPKLYPSNTAPVGANKAQVSGVVMDATSNTPIAGAVVTAVPQVGAVVTATTGVEGSFSFGNLDGATVELRVSANGYQNFTTQYMLLPGQTLDLGQIRLVPPKVTRLQPDLKVLQVKRNTARTDAQTLQLGGAVEVVVTNVGTTVAPPNVTVLAFRDVNEDNGWTPGVDLELGRSTLTQSLSPSQSASFVIDVAGPMTMRDGVIHVVIDPQQSSNDANRGNNIGSTGLYALINPVAAAFQPKLKWEWFGGEGPLPDWDNVEMTPLVIPTRDTNGDGRIDTSDSPTVFASFFRAYGRYDDYWPAVVRAFDGVTGRLLTTNVDHKVYTLGQLAAADIDGDGKVEVIAIGFDGLLRAFNGEDLSLKWIARPNTSVESSLIFSAPTLVDLDGDGKSEILIGNKALRSDGTLFWESSSSLYANCIEPRGCAPYAIDLEGSIGRAVIYGTSLVKAIDGTVIWNRSDLTYGMGATAVFGTATVPSIAVISGAAGKIYLLNSVDGSTIWQQTIPGLRCYSQGGPPTIADFDGDGQADIGLATCDRYTVFRGDGSVLWSKKLDSKDTSGFTGSTLFDFDGNGIPEVIYSNEFDLFALNGYSGEVIFRTPNYSGTGMEYPIVADVDSDGHADIVIGGNSYFRVGNGLSASSPMRGLRVLQDINNSWVGVRNIWNQHAYSITNINDDLTVPRNPVSSWRSHNTFRLNKRIDGDSRAVPDLTLGYARINDGGSQASQVTWRIGNAGGYRSSPGVNVALYGTTPVGTVQGIAVVPIAALQPGQYQDISFTLYNLSSYLTLTAVVDDDGTGHTKTIDFDRSNNAHAIDLQTLARNVTLVGAQTDKPSYVGGEGAIFMAPVTNAGSFIQDVQIRFTVLDSNNQRVDILPTTTAVTIAAGASALISATWSTSAVLAGGYQLLAELVTSQGVVYGSATANFAVTASQQQVNAARISADRSTYSAAQSVQITSRVTNASSNTVQDDVRAVTQVFNSAGQSVFSQSEPIAQFTPNSLRSYSYSLPASALAAGNYQASVQLLSAQGSILAQSSTSFVVQDTSQTGVGIRGQLQANPSVALIGQGVALNLQVNNSGNAALANLPVTIRVIDPQSGAVLATYTQTLASLTIGQSLPVNANWTSAGTDGQILMAAATANLNGQDIALAQAQIRLQGIPALSVTPASLNFGVAYLSSNGQISPTVPAQLVTLRSTGSAAVQTLSWSLIGTDTNAFQLQGGTCTAGMSLPMGSSCTLAIGYQPTQVKTHQAQLYVTHASSGSIPERVALQGQTVQTQTLSLESKPTPPRDARILVLVSCTQSASKSDHGNGDDEEHDEDHDEEYGDHGDDHRTSHDNRCSASHAEEHDDDDDRRTRRGNSCSPQPQQSSCVSTRAQAIGQYLNSLGILNKVVTDEASFRHEMRCGGYNTYWISGGASKLEDYLVKEVREAIWRGDGLIIDGQHDDRNLLLDAAAGVKYRGKLSGTSYTASIPATSIFAQGDAASTMATLGQPAKYDLLTGQAQARFTGSSVPAIVSNRYGAGQAILFTFDLAAMITQDIQQSAAINPLLQHIVSITADQVGAIASSTSASAQPLTIGDIQAQGISLRNPSSQTVTAQITISLPAQLTYSSASLSPINIVAGSATGIGTTAAQINWLISLAPQQSQELIWRVKVQSVPTATATFTVAVQVFSTGQSAGSSQLQASHSFSLQAISGSALIAKVLPAVQALQPVPSAERNAKIRAITAVTSATSLHNQARYSEAIVKWTDAADELLSMSSLSSASASTATQATYAVARKAVAFVLEASTDGQCQALICLRGDLAFGNPAPVLGSRLNISRAVTNRCPAPLSKIRVTTSLSNRRNGQNLFSFADDLNLSVNQTNTRNAAWQVRDSHQGTQAPGGNQPGDWIDGILTADWQGHRIELDAAQAQISKTAPQRKTAD